MWNENQVLPVTPVVTRVSSAIMLVCIGDSLGKSGSVLGVTGLKVLDLTGFRSAETKVIQLHYVTISPVLFRWSPTLN